MEEFNPRSPIRLSDIDNLLQESIFESSDGAKLVEYLKKKRGGGGRVRLQNIFQQVPVQRAQFNFNLDTTEPTPLPESPEATTSNAARVPENVAQFEVVVPEVAVTTATVDEQVADDSPPVPIVIVNDLNKKATVKQIMLKSPGPMNALSRQVLINQYQRTNAAKCELLKQLASSTPKPDSNGTLGRMSTFTTSISPIVESSPMTPCEVIPSSQPMQVPVVMEIVVPPPAAHEVLVPCSQPILAPCSQAVPDGTPQKVVVLQSVVNPYVPTTIAEEVVIPETPSPMKMVTESPKAPPHPVHMQPRRLSTTFKQMEEAEAAAMEAAAAVAARENGHMTSDESDVEEEEEESPAGNSILLKSILKDTSMGGSGRSRHSFRVSFSRQLVQQREISPAPDIPDANYNDSNSTDESDASDSDTDDNDYQVVDEVYTDDDGEEVEADHQDEFEELKSRICELNNSHNGHRSASPLIDVVKETPVQWFETTTPTKRHDEQAAEEQQFPPPTTAKKDNKTNLQLVDIITDWDDEEDEEDGDQSASNADADTTQERLVEPRQSTNSNHHETNLDTMDISSSNLEDSIERLVELPPAPNGLIEEEGVLPEEHIYPAAVDERMPLLTVPITTEELVEVLTDDTDDGCPAESFVYEPQVESSPEVEEVEEQQQEEEQQEEEQQEEEQQEEEQQEEDQHEEPEVGQLEEQPAEEPSEEQLPEPTDETPPPVEEEPPVELPPPPPPAPVPEEPPSPERVITPPVQFTNSAKRRFIQDTEDELISRLQNDLPLSQPSQETDLSESPVEEEAPRVSETLVEIAQSFRDQPVSVSSSSSAMAPPSSKDTTVTNVTVNRTVVPPPRKRGRNRRISTDPVTVSYFEAIEKTFAKPKVPPAQRKKTDQKRKLYDATLSEVTEDEESMRVEAVQKPVKMTAPAAAVVVEAVVPAKAAAVVEAPKMRELKVVVCKLQLEDHLPRKEPESREQEAAKVDAPSSTTPTTPTMTEAVKKRGVGRPPSRIRSVVKEGTPKKKRGRPKKVSPDVEHPQTDVEPEPPAVVSNGVEEEPLASEVAKKKHLPKPNLTESGPTVNGCSEEVVEKESAERSDDVANESSNEVVAETDVREGDHQQKKRNPKPNLAGVKMSEEAPPTANGSSNEVVEEDNLQQKKRKPRPNLAGSEEQQRSDEGLPAVDNLPIEVVEEPAEREDNLKQKKRKPKPNLAAVSQEPSNEPSVAAQDLPDEPTSTEGVTNDSAVAPEDDTPREDKLEQKKKKKLKPNLVEVVRDLPSEPDVVKEADANSDSVEPPRKQKRSKPTLEPASQESVPQEPAVVSQPEPVEQITKENGAKKKKRSKPNPATASRESVPEEPVVDAQPEHLEVISKEDGAKKKQPKPNLAAVSREPEEPAVVAQVEPVEQVLKKKKLKPDLAAEPTAVPDVQVEQSSQELVSKKKKPKPNLESQPEPVKVVAPAETAVEEPPKEDRAKPKKKLKPNFGTKSKQQFAEIPPPVATDEEIQNQQKSAPTTTSTESPQKSKEAKVKLTKMDVTPMMQGSMSPASRAILLRAQPAASPRRLFAAADAELPGIVPLEQQQVQKESKSDDPSKKRKDSKGTVTHVDPIPKVRISAEKDGIYKITSPNQENLAEDSFVGRLNVTDIENVRTSLEDNPEEFLGFEDNGENQDATMDLSRSFLEPVILLEPAKIPEGVEIQLASNENQKPAKKTLKKVGERRPSRKSTDAAESEPERPASRSGDPKVPKKGASKSTDAESEVAQRRSRSRSQSPTKKAPKPREMQPMGKSTDASVSEPAVAQLSVGNRSRSQSPMKKTLKKSREAVSRKSTDAVISEPENAQLERSTVENRSRSRSPANKTPKKGRGRRPSRKSTDAVVSEPEVAQPGCSTDENRSLPLKKRKSRDNSREVVAAQPSQEEEPPREDDDDFETSVLAGLNDSMLIPMLQRVPIADKYVVRSTADPGTESTDYESDDASTNGDNVLIVRKDMSRLEQSIMVDLEEEAEREANLNRKNFKRRESIPLPRFYGDNTFDLTWKPKTKTTSRKNKRRLDNDSGIEEEDVVRRSKRTCRISKQILMTNPYIKSAYDRPNYRPMTVEQLAEAEQLAKKLKQEEKAKQRKPRTAVPAAPSKPKRSPSRKRPQEPADAPEEEQQQAKRTRADSVTDEQVAAPSSSAAPPAAAATAVTATAVTCTEVAVQAELIQQEKQQAQGWMMKLMAENSGREEIMPQATSTGDRMHFQLDHLTYQERNGIQYSFFIYSETENFGFLRFAPAAVKKWTKTADFLLKFLVLHGQLSFQINGKETVTKGGDFLMLPQNTRYRIQNSDEISLVFMIKFKTAQSELPSM